MIKYIDIDKFNVTVNGFSSFTLISGIKYIKYYFDFSSYSPAVAMYINYENIQSSSNVISDGYLSVIGFGICD